MTELQDHCPLNIAINIISGKYKLFILRTLFAKESYRYSELRKACNKITEKMLTQQLRELEKDGIVSRKVYPQVPPKVEYSLTVSGQKLCMSLHPLYDWGVEYMKENQPDIQV
ncbi:helix-turn-helix domain-containing protein [Rapidithrix thailandica]|uniref:Helix-turn-helix domain-containing protein n=1 Tax=Rapidithrix thailandica TaxID=413964 RepID=A0AAW9S3W7_9BACT